MYKEYCIDTYSELVEFISENKSNIIGKPIDKYYCLLGDMNRISDEHIVLEIDGICICMFYMTKSSIIVDVFSRDLFREDASGDFMWLDIPEDRTVTLEVECDEDFPLYGLCIEDISAERFTHEFEIDIRGNTRPDGGDYFSTIKFHMEDGRKLCICAEEACADGYVAAWIED